MKRFRNAAQTILRMFLDVKAEYSVLYPSLRVGKENRKKES
jgi:hypothetical protein